MSFYVIHDFVTITVTMFDVTDVWPSDVVTNPNPKF